MILLIVGQGGESLIEDAASFTEPNFDERPPERVAENSRFVAWMEVYLTIDALFEAVISAALRDPVCRAMLSTLEEELGLALLRPQFLRVSERQLERVAVLFWRVLHPWCDPLVGNPQTPAMPSQKIPARLAEWSTRFNLSEDSTKAIAEYAKLDSDRPRCRDAPRAQVRAFFNIVDLTRAVLAEVVTHPVRRVDKLLALRLCRSKRLLKRQQAFLSDYLKRHRDLILDAAGAGTLTINDTQYLKYYLGAYSQTVGKKDPKLVRELLEGVLDIALGGDGSDNEVLEPVFDIWRTLPPVIQGAVLFNDLRKLFEKAERALGPTREQADKDSSTGDGDFGGGQVYTRASLILPGFPKRTGHDVRVWPAKYHAEEPGGDPPPYPNNSVPFLRSWNPDEYAPYAMAYRINLCPLWAGPSGHTVNAIRHWVYALGGRKCPDDVATVVATTLFVFWRLYYDKRISAAHTLTEAFEATLVAAAGASKTGEGFEVKPAPATRSVLGDSDDAFELVTACRLKGEYHLWATHPIGVLRQAFRALWPGLGFAGYEGAKRAIDQESGQLVSERYAVPRWSHDASKATGIDVSNYAPPKDPDWRPDPEGVLDLARKLFGPVLEAVRDGRDAFDDRQAPWSHHHNLLDAIRQWPLERARRGDARRRNVAAELAIIANQLTRLAGDVSWGYFRNGPLRAYLPTGFADQVADVQRRAQICDEALNRSPRVNSVNVSALPPEPFRYLEQPFLRLRVALYRASQRVVPNGTRTSLQRYFQALKGAWYRLAALTEVDRLPRPTALTLPQPLDPSVRRTVDACQSFIQRFDRVFNPLSNDANAKTYKRLIGRVPCAEIRQLYRELKQDSKYFGSVAKERFFDVDLRNLVGLKVRQFAQNAPTTVELLLLHIEKAQPAKYEKLEKKALSSYRSRLGHVLEDATAIALQARKLGGKAPAERIRLQPLQLGGESLAPSRFTRSPQKSPSASVRTTSTASTRDKRSIGSTPSRSKLGPKLDNHWYTCDEVRLVTRLRLADMDEQVYFMLGIDSELHGGFTMEDNLREALVAILGTTVEHIIVPVHVGGNHWTALHIQFNLGADTPYLSPTIQYADPTGAGDIPGALRRALDDIFPGATIRPRSTRAYQPPYDGHNCGPWTAFLLEFMVRNGGALPARDAIVIGTRRAADQRLIQDSFL